MSRIKLNIDGREVTGFEGQTVLDIAKENGVDIPTLCHDERVAMYGSCGLCVVEVEGNPRLLRSCSTLAADGMVVSTNTGRVRLNRKTALELLLSDHTGDCRPPCALACPAETDCQGYAGLIANGEYREAVKLIKDKIPLPSSIGRVCPHPCEDACRRKLVEEPVSIAALKSFAGDLDLEEPYTAEVGKPTGKAVAIVGGGPGGLTAAYFLRTHGHDVTVFDAMPHMGGMLRYGIPEYRLPKKLLQTEIDAIQRMGVVFHNKVRIGHDLTLNCLRRAYDAVVVAVGAWSSVGLRCPGEEFIGVMGGVDFLRGVALGKPVVIGNRVAVVGGGNTAMDACRTAVRLGASEVYNIYRRTRNEMPAEEIEIAEAEEEGVVFKNLTNPIEIIGENGKVKAVRLQIMELGQPDASGRRAPVPVEGKEQTIEVDTVIVAIGQKFTPDGFEELEQTKWRTVASDEHTCRTSLEGVFAIGDAVNKGADIAISAIAGGKKAAVMIDRYLCGESMEYTAPFLVKDEKTEADFADREKQPRVKACHREASERRKDFLEIGRGYTEEEARREASRCLECGCQDYFECKLIDYANRYAVQPEKFQGMTHRRATEGGHPFIRRNPDKCILCGLCVRICDEVVGATALGLVNRGFDAQVKPALDLDLCDSGCIACGQCVAVCPTGALTEVEMSLKQVPVLETVTDTVCSFCSVGCKSRLTSSGTTLLRNLPASESGSLLCMKGRFGFGELAKVERMTSPAIRADDGFTKTSFEQAAVFANKGLQSVTARHGAGSVGVAISGRYTNEEAFLIKEYAQKALGTDKVFSFGLSEGGIAGVLGRDSSNAAFDELDGTGLIVAVDHGLYKRHAVAGMRIKQAVANGARLLLISDGDSLLDGIAELKLDTTALKQIALALLDGASGIEGLDELGGSLKGIKAGDAAHSAAEMIKTAKKAIFVFERDAVTPQGAALIADIAVLGGHGGSRPRDGIIQLLPDANTQGLIDLGVRPGADCLQAIENGELHGLFIFGEDIAEGIRQKLEFVAVQELFMTNTAKTADVVFPASSFAESGGSYTSADGRVRELKQVLEAPAGGNIAQIMALSEQTGAVLPYIDIDSIRLAMNKKSDSKTTAVRLAAAHGDITRDGGHPDTNALRVRLMEYAAQQGCV